MFNKQGFSDRLQTFRNRLGRTAREMSLDLGLHPATITQIEAGKFSLSLELLDRMASTYGLNIHWIITGYGPMKIAPLINGRVVESSGAYESAYPMVKVPILSTFLSLGEPVAQAAERVTDFAQVIKPLVPHPRHTYGLKARGDSMAPVIQDRWLVLVDVHEDAIRPYESLKGHPVAVRLGEGVSIKWLTPGKSDWIIHAENEASGFRDVRISRQVDPPVVGRCIWWCPSI